MLETRRPNIAVDENGLQINISYSQWKCVSDIFTPCGAFSQSKEVIQNLSFTATFFDH